MPKKQDASLGKRAITYGKRYIKHNREKAVKDILDALVEIVTNCDDSYHNLFHQKKRPADGGDILIEIERRQKHNSRVVVKDKAEGMTLAQMRAKLGHAGERTSGEGSRGFMARGLRDCTALGDVRVDSIVDGKHHACRLTQNLDFEDLADGGKITEQLKRALGTAKKNGTMVTLDYASPIRFPQIDTLARDLPMHYALRDMVGEKSQSKIRLRRSGGEAKTLTLPPISGAREVNAHFQIDGYSDSECHLQIWRAPSPLPCRESRVRLSGILISGGRTIHQCTLLNYEGEKLAHHYHGRLHCDYIQQLLKEHDKRLEDETPHPRSNPRLLIDPNRQSGLDSTHPFAVKIFEKIREHLDPLIERDRRAAESKQGDISDRKTRQLLNKLADVANQFQKEYVDDDASPGEEKALNTAKKQGVYVMPPKFKIGVGEIRTLTVYSRNNHYDSNRKPRVSSSDERVISIEEAIPGNKLKQHHLDESVFYGSLKVRGRALGTSTITFRPNKDGQTATAHGEVVKKRNPKSPDLEDELEFERQLYNIPEGKTKTLNIFADSSLMDDSDTLVAMVSCRDEEVSVKGGGQCRLRLQAGGGYAMGAIEVKGAALTQKRVTVTARINEKTATTKVRVIEPKKMEGGFRFEIVPDNLGELRARWADIKQMPNLLEISAAHPSTKKHFGAPPDFEGQKNKESRILLAELITESVCLRILGREMVARPGSFQFDGKEPRYVLDEVNRELQKRISEFAPKAHRILVDEQ